MSTLPIPSVMKPVVKVIEKDHSVIISSTSSTALICTLCGGRKAVISYTDVYKYLVYSGDRTCRCQYAPNPGGDMASLMSPIVYEQQQLLSDLYERPTIEEVRLAMPITPARGKYDADFQDMLERLYLCKTIAEARSVMERYSIAKAER